jgi:hypothetical protein
MYDISDTICQDVFRIVAFETIGEFSPSCRYDVVPVSLVDLVNSINYTVLYLV